MSLSLPRRYGSLVVFSFIILGCFFFMDVGALKCTKAVQNVDSLVQMKYSKLENSKLENSTGENSTNADTVSCGDQCMAAFCLKNVTGEAVTWKLVEGCWNTIIEDCGFTQEQLPQVPKNETCFWHPELPIVVYATNQTSSFPNLAGCVDFLKAAYEWNNDYVGFLKVAEKERLDVISFSPEVEKIPYPPPAESVTCRYFIGSADFDTIESSPGKFVRCLHQCFAITYVIDGKYYWYEGCVEEFLDKYPKFFNDPDAENKLKHLEEDCFFPPNYDIIGYACSKGGDCREKYYACYHYLHNLYPLQDSAIGLMRHPPWTGIPHHYGEVKVTYNTSDQLPYVCHMMDDAEKVPDLDLSRLPEQNNILGRCVTKCIAAFYIYKGEAKWVESCAAAIDFIIPNGTDPLAATIVDDENDGKCGFHPKKEIVFVAGQSGLKGRHLLLDCIRNYQDAHASNDTIVSQLIENNMEKILKHLPAHDTAGESLLKYHKHGYNPNEYGDDSEKVDGNMAALNVFGMVKALAMMAVLIWFLPS